MKMTSLVVAAASKTGLPVRLAGDYRPMPDALKKAPSNVKFVGRLARVQLRGFHRNGYFSVVPSVCLRASGLVVRGHEPRPAGHPLADKGLPEIVDDGVTRVLFERGKAKSQTENVKLPRHPPTCASGWGGLGGGRQSGSAVRMFIAGDQYLFVKER
jgi:hypothetical protein